MKYLLSMIIFLETLQATILIGENSIRAKGMAGAYTAIGEGPDVSYHNSAYYIESIEESSSIAASMSGPPEGSYSVEPTNSSRSSNMDGIQIFNLQIPFFFDTSAQLGYQGVSLYTIGTSDLHYIDMAKGVNVAIAIPLIEETLSIGATIRFPDSFLVNNFSLSTMYRLINSNDFQFRLAANTNYIDHTLSDTTVPSIIYQDYSFGGGMKYYTDWGEINFAYDYTTESLFNGSAEQTINSDAYGIELMGSNHGIRMGYYRTRENTYADIEAYTFGTTTIFDFKGRSRINSYIGFDLAFEFRTSVLANTILDEFQFGFAMHVSPDILLEAGLRSLAH